MHTLRHTGAVFTVVIWSLLSTVAVHAEQEVITFSSKATPADIARRLHAPVRLVDPPSALLEELRWATPSPAMIACEESAARVVDRLRAEGLLDTLTPKGTELYRALLTQAANQLQLMDLEAVLSTLEEARGRLPCVDSILSVQDLRPLYLYEAVSHYYLRDGQDERGFRNLLAVDNRSFLEPEYPPAIREVFTAVFHELLNDPLITPDVGGLVGDVYIDGISTSDLQPLHPGLHVVQARGPGGRIRTVQVELKADDSSNAPVWLADLVDFGLPTTVETREALVRSLEKGALTLHQIEVLQDDVKKHRRSGLIFAVDDGESVVLRGFLPDGGLCDPRDVVRASAGEAVRPAPPSTDRPRNDALGIDVALGFGARFLLGPRGAYQLTGLGSGYALRIGVPIERWIVEGRLETTRHFFRPLSNDEACGGFDGVGIPTDDEARAAIACIPSRATLALALAGGRMFALFDALRFIPTLGLESLRLPNTLINTEDPASIRIADVWYTGLMARPRVMWVFSGSDPEWTAEMELDVGGFVGRVDDSWLWNLPLGATFSVGAEF